MYVALVAEGILISEYEIWHGGTTYICILTALTVATLSCLPGCSRQGGKDRLKMKALT